MTSVRHVAVGAQPITALESVPGPPRYQAFAATAGETADALGGRLVVNVNSTAAGGGVAEMLRALLAYASGAGIESEWLALDAPAEFFDVTKRVHNRLYGSRGDDGALGASERRR